MSVRNSVHSSNGGMNSSTHNPNLNWLSLARCFLFASRDFWFEVPLPYFLRSSSCTAAAAAAAAMAGSGEYASGEEPDPSSLVCGGPGWERVVVGAILGGYIILYGQVQSWTPQLVLGPLGQDPPNKLTEVLWGLLNCIPTATMAVVAYAYGATLEDAGETPAAVTAWLMVVVVCFALVFAVNSSVHSFLVVHYAKADKGAPRAAAHPRTAARPRAHCRHRPTAASPLP